MRLSFSSLSMYPLSIKDSILNLIYAGSGLNFRAKSLVDSVIRLICSIFRRAFITLMIEASIVYRRSSSTLPCTLTSFYSLDALETMTGILFL